VRNREQNIAWGTGADEWRKSQRVSVGSNRDPEKNVNKAMKTQTRLKVKVNSSKLKINRVDEAVRKRNVLLPVSLKLLFICLPKYVEFNIIPTTKTDFG
jgi:hypothetical protein